MTTTGSTVLKRQYEVFVRGLVAGLAGAEAYRRAGYKAKNADVCAVQLQKRPDIQARLEYLQAKAIESLDIEIDRILQEDTYIAFSDVKDLLDEEGNPIPVEQLPDKVSHAISSLKITTDQAGRTVTEYKLWPKDKSLDRFYRYKGLYEKDNVQSTPQFLLAIGRADEDKAKKVISEIKDRDRLESGSDVTEVVTPVTGDSHEDSDVTEVVTWEL